MDCCSRKGLFIALFLILLPVQGQNINCNGKPFYCINSTHFKICVDLGGGISSTVDNFLIPCPSNTFCDQTNQYECEFQTKSLEWNIQKRESTYETTTFRTIFNQRDATDIITLSETNKKEYPERYSIIISTPAAQYSTAVINTRIDDDEMSSFLGVTNSQIDESNNTSFFIEPESNNVKIQSSLILSANDDVVTTNKKQSSLMNNDIPIQFETINMTNSSTYEINEVTRATDTKNDITIPTLATYNALNLEIVENMPSTLEIKEITNSTETEKNSKSSISISQVTNQLNLTSDLTSYKDSNNAIPSPSIIERVTKSINIKNNEVPYFFDIKENVNSSDFKYNNSYHDMNQFTDPTYVNDNNTTFKEVNLSTFVKNNTLPLNIIINETVNSVNTENFTTPSSLVIKEITKTNITSNISLHALGINEVANQIHLQKNITPSLLIIHTTTDPTNLQNNIMSLSEETKEIVNSTAISNNTSESSFVVQEIINVTKTNNKISSSSPNIREVIDQTNLNNSLKSTPLIFNEVINESIFPNTSRTNEANKSINLTHTILAPDIVVHNIIPIENTIFNTFSFPDFSEVENRTNIPESISTSPLPRDDKVTDPTYIKYDNTSWNRKVVIKKVTYPTIDQNNTKPLFLLTNDTTNKSFNITNDIKTKSIKNDNKPHPLLINIKETSLSQDTSTSPVLIANEDLNLTTNLTYIKYNTLPSAANNEVTVSTEIKNNNKDITMRTNNIISSYQKTNEVTESTYKKNISKSLPVVINKPNDIQNSNASVSRNYEVTTLSIMENSITPSFKEIKEANDRSDPKNNLTIFPNVASQLAPSSNLIIKDQNSTNSENNTISHLLIRQEVNNISESATETTLNLLPNEFIITKTSTYEDIIIKGDEHKTSNSVLGTFITQTSTPELKSRVTKNSQATNTTLSFAIDTFVRSLTNAEDQSVIIDKKIFNETILLKPSTKPKFLNFGNFTDAYEMLNASTDTKIRLNYSNQPYVGSPSIFINNFPQSFNETSQESKNTTLNSMQPNEALLKESENKSQLPYELMKYDLNNTHLNILTNITDQMIKEQILSSSASPTTEGISTIFYNTHYLPVQSLTEPTTKYSDQNYTPLNYLTTVTPSGQNQTFVGIYDANLRQNLDLNKTLENKEVLVPPNLNINIVNNNKVFLRNLTINGSETFIINRLSSVHKISTPALNVNTESQNMSNIFYTQNQSTQGNNEVEMQSNSSNLEHTVLFSSSPTTEISTKSAMVNMGVPITEINQIVTTHIQSKMVKVPGEAMQMTLSNYKTKNAPTSYGIDVNILLESSIIIQNKDTPSPLSLITQNKTKEALRTTDATIAINTAINLNSFDLQTEPKLIQDKLQEKSDNDHPKDDSFFKFFSNVSNTLFNKNNKYEDNMRFSTNKVEETTSLPNIESKSISHKIFNIQKGDKTHEVVTSKRNLATKLQINDEMISKSKIISPNIKGPHILINNFVNNTYCLNRTIGRYSYQKNCSKFYICMGEIHPLVGECSVNTVFNDVHKLCTKNLSYCVRNNQFRCLASGRYYDILLKNTYYICVQNKSRYIKFKFQCQQGYTLNTTIIQCIHNGNNLNSSSDLGQDLSSGKDGSDSKENNSSKGNEFKCKSQGKFADPNDCKKYFVCSNNIKFEFRRRRKSCDTDEVWHTEKQKCVEEDSYECKIEN